MGVAMSVTAFPVLARILIERRMLRRPVGALSMAGAAIDDVTAWCLLALAAAIAGSGELVARAPGRRAGRRSSARRCCSSAGGSSDASPRPTTRSATCRTLWLGVIFVGVLLSAFVAQQIGIAAIFGAFMMGLIMPRRAGLTADVSERFESFVVLVLLPLFFVVTGLRTEVNALNRPVLWALTLLLIAVAIVGKFVGAMLAARYGGFSLRDSAAVGALMNTRGLTELIVLNIGLELGVISTQLFTMLVVMALVTTFMAGPILRLIDPRHELSEPVEEELRQAVRTPSEDVAVAAPARAILVAPQDEKNLDALLDLAEPLAKVDTAPRARDRSGRAAGPLLTGTSLDSAEVADDVGAARARRAPSWPSAASPPARSPSRASCPARTTCSSPRRRRSTSCCSTAGGRCSARGSRAARSARCSRRRRATSPCSSSGRGCRRSTRSIPVMVPFGGGDHDWAALELAAWIASAHDTPLKLLGAAGAANGGGDASRVLELRLARRAAARRGRRPRRCSSTWPTTA